MTKGKIITAKSSDVKDLESFGPYDVKHTGDYPWCSVGKVITQYGHGTGCLIGPNIVLTAAHVCINLLTGIVSKQIYFTPSLLNDRAKFKGFKATKLYFPEEIKKCADPNIDQN